MIILKGKINMNRREEVFKSFNKYKEETEDRVKNGIEQNRKGFTKISVKDKDGNAVCGAKIKAKQKKHEFLYGANLFMLDEMEAEEKNIKYREMFKDCFNLATLPFYWSDLEPVQGKPRFEKDSPKVYRRPAPDLCLEYCEKYGITPKAHCLTYFNFQPDWVNKEDINDMKKKLEIRYSRLAERYKDRIHGWEVINELLLTWEILCKNKFFISDDVLEWNFELAKKYFPNNELILNEAAMIWERGRFAYNRSDYYLMIKEALEKGVRIDTIGMQFHMFKSREDELKSYDAMYNPKQLFDVLDCYARFNKPIQITEITIPAFGESAEDEEIQADLIEQLYSIWFSHKAVEAIIYWNLVDGYAAFAEPGDMSGGENSFRGGLLRFDMSKKPAYDRIHDLFTKRWITETETETGKDGTAKFKGFYGDYELEINGRKYDISTSVKKDNEFEITI